MLKKTLINIAAAGALLIATTPAQADCFGCNITDDGTIQQLSPGHIVYTHSAMYGSDPVQVLQIDRTQGRVLVRNSSGQRQWYLATSLYAGNRINERNVATIGGTLALFALLTGAAGSGSSASGSDGGYNNWLATRPNQDEARRGSRQRDNSSDGCFWGNREDGTCN